MLYNNLVQSKPEKRGDQPSNVVFILKKKNLQFNLTHFLISEPFLKMVHSFWYQHDSNFNGTKSAKGYEELCNNKFTSNTMTTCIWMNNKRKTNLI